MQRTQGSSGLKVAIWSIVVIVVALGLIIVVKVHSNSQQAATSGRTLASASLLDKVSHLDTYLNQVGQGSTTKLPQTVTGAPALTKDNKPKIVYIGAEYCPYCATERWPMVVALSRFGTFKNLGTTTSSATDAYPSTATFSFSGATYTSNVIAFEGVEQYSNQPSASGGGYTPLDTLTAEQNNILKTYDATPYVSASSAGSIPFIYFGGKFLIAGSSYNPGVLQGKTVDQIADALKDPKSDIGQGVLGTANAITAAICSLTNNQPSNVCSSQTIKDLQAQLGK